MLIAAANLAARKLSQYEGPARVPATVSAIADAIRQRSRFSRRLISGGRRGEVAPNRSHVIVIPRGR